MKLDKGIGMLVPLPFVLVGGFAIALIIFFGAWAVSADQGQWERAFAASYGTGPSATPGDSSGTAGLQRDRVAGAAPNGSTAADTWWGKGFLAACPLH